MPKKLTTEDFIKRVKDVHGDRYDYSLVKYINMMTHIDVICNKHKIIFQITPTKHIHRKQGCSICGREKQTLSRRSNLIDIINKANLVHNNKYDYSLVYYVNHHTKIKIICPIYGHGIFEQVPTSHIHGKNGCPKCANNQHKTLDIFIIGARKIHGDKYDYSLVEYNGAHTIIKIICKEKNRVFLQTPDIHLRGGGCTCCKSSKGETKIFKILEKKKIIFEQQKKYSKCKYKQPLPFDFYLPEHNTLIEFDGEQHFRRFRFEKDDTKLKHRQRNDQIKNQFCKDNNIPLYRIRYDENIEEKMNEIISKLS